MLTVPMYERLVGLRVTEIVTKPLVDGRLHFSVDMVESNPLAVLSLPPEEAHKD